jgi:hypothetical protein
MISHYRIAEQVGSGEMGGGASSRQGLAKSSQRRSDDSRYPIWIPAALYPELRLCDKLRASTGVPRESLLEPRHSGLEGLYTRLSCAMKKPDPPEYLHLTDSAPEADPGPPARILRRAAAKNQEEHPFFESSSQATAALRRTSDDLGEASATAGQLRRNCQPGRPWDRRRLPAHRQLRA